MRKGLQQTDDICFEELFASLFCISMKSTKYNRRKENNKYFYKSRSHLSYRYCVSMFRQQNDALLHICIYHISELSWPWLFVKSLFLFIITARWSRSQGGQRYSIHLSARPNIQVWAQSPSIRKFQVIPAKFQATPAKLQAIPAKSQAFPAIFQAIPANLQVILAKIQGIQILGNLSLISVNPGQFSGHPSEISSNPSWISGNPGQISGNTAKFQAIPAKLQAIQLNFQQSQPNIR